MKRGLAPTIGVYQMSDQTHEPTSDDDVVEIIKEVVDQIPGMTLMTPAELTEFMEDGKRAIEAADEKARDEGRRFVDEETDQELIETWWREAENCASIDDASDLAKRLVTDYRHDYGTICHAIAVAGIAMANAIQRSPQGGVTGFQAGAIGWMLHGRWMRWEDSPRRLFDYSDLLLPQYDHSFCEISTDTAEWLVEKAKSNLAKNKNAHPNVKKRWKEIAAGQFPAFVTVESAS